MKYRIKKETNLKGDVFYTPQVKKFILFGWEDFLNFNTNHSLYFDKLKDAIDFIKEQKKRYEEEKLSEIIKTVYIYDF
jgi:hypothetical protein